MKGYQFILLLAYFNCLSLSSKAQYDNFYILEVRDSVLSLDAIVTLENIQHVSINGEYALGLNSQHDYIMVNLSNKEQLKENVIGPVKERYKIITDIELRPNSNHVGHTFFGGELMEDNPEEELVYSNAIYSTPLTELAYTPNDSFTIVITVPSKSCESCSYLFSMDRTYPNSQEYYNIRKKKHASAIVPFDKMGYPKSIIKMQNESQNLQVSMDSQKAAFLSEGNLYVYYLFKDYMDTFSIHNDAIIDYCFYATDTMLTINESGKVSLVQYKTKQNFPIEANFEMTNPINIGRLKNFITVTTPDKIYLCQINGNHLQLVDTYKATEGIRKIKSYYTTDSIVFY